MENDPYPDSMFVETVSVLFDRSTGTRMNGREFASMLAEQLASARASGQVMLSRPATVDLVVTGSEGAFTWILSGDAEITLAPYAEVRPPIGRLLAPAKVMGFRAGIMARRATVLTDFDPMDEIETAAMVADDDRSLIGMAAQRIRAARDSLGGVW